MQPLVYVIMLNYNGIEHLKYSLPSVLTTRYYNYKLIVVDNNSTDDSVAFIKSNYPCINILCERKNKGWAAGNNVGLKLAINNKAKYTILINNDILVHPDWLKNAVLVCEENKKIGAVGFTGLSLQREKHILTHAIAKPAPIEYKSVDIITGWALFIRTEALSNVGLIDEMFGSFGEEIDLEWRLKIANYKLIQLNTLLCHYSGGSFSKYPVTAAYLMMRNTLRLNIKYYKFRKLHADSKMILYRIKQGRTDQSAKDGYFYTNCLIPKGKMYSLLLFVCAVIWNIMFLPVTIFSGVIAIKRAKIAAKIDI